VMPNHVHVLLEPHGAVALSTIVHSWKSYSAKRILALDFRVTATNRVWQREYFDRFIRDESHYRSALEYIAENPVKAGLARSAKEWMWSSMGGA